MNGPPVMIRPDDPATPMAGSPTVLIDARDSTASAAGHLPGAIHRRAIATLLARRRAEGLRGLASTVTAAFGAAGRSGEETAVVHDDALNTGSHDLPTGPGCPKVRVLAGACPAGTAAGRPVSIPPGVARPATCPERPRAEVMVDTAPGLAAPGQPGLTPRVVREGDGGTGASPSPSGRDFAPRQGDPAAAHGTAGCRAMTPGADGRPPRRLLGDQAACATVGLTPQDPGIVHGVRGSRASNTVLALRQAGVRDMPGHVGAGHEGSRDPTRPAEDSPPRARAA